MNRFTPSALSHQTLPWARAAVAAAMESPRPKPGRLLTPDER